MRLSLLQRRRAMFHEAFAYHDERHDHSVVTGTPSGRTRKISTADHASKNPAANLLAKLIGILEHVENLPLVVNDPSGAPQNLQVWQIIVLMGCE